MTIIVDTILGVVTSALPTAYADSLAFLLSQLGARSAQLFAERLAPLGVSARTYGVLSNLAGSGSPTQQQLADALGIHRNNMVGLIDELEAAGWVRRHRSERDRRAFELRLTEDGASLVSRIDRLIPGLESEMGRGLTVADRRALIELLGRVADALELTPGVHPSLRRAR